MRREGCARGLRELRREAGRRREGRSVAGDERRAPGGLCRRVERGGARSRCGPARRPPAGRKRAARRAGGCTGDGVRRDPDRCDVSGALRRPGEWSDRRRRHLVLERFVVDEGELDGAEPAVVRADGIAPGERGSLRRHQRAGQRYDVRGHVDLGRYELDAARRARALGVQRLHRNGRRESRRLRRLGHAGLRGHVDLGRLELDEARRDRAQRPRPSVR